MSYSEILWNLHPCPPLKIPVRTPEPSELIPPVLTEEIQALKEQDLGQQEFYGEAGKMPEPKSCVEGGRPPAGVGGELSISLEGRQEGGRGTRGGEWSVFTINLELHRCELLGRQLASSRRSPNKSKCLGCGDQRASRVFGMGWGLVLVYSPC